MTVTAMKRCALQMTRVYDYLCKNAPQDRGARALAWAARNLVQAEVRKTDVGFGRGRQRYHRNNQFEYRRMNNEALASLTAWMQGVASGEVCPSCNATLMNPEAPCLNCLSKTA